MNKTFLHHRVILQYIYIFITLLFLSFINNRTERNSVHAANFPTLHIQHPFEYLQKAHNTKCTYNSVCADPGKDAHILFPASLRALSLHWF